MKFLIRLTIKLIGRACGLQSKVTMEDDLQRIISAIVSNIRKDGGYVTKTKLLKLLYLFDVEYYRIHRKTFTGFDWKYHFLGPWTEQYDPLLSNLVANGILNDTPSSSPDIEAHFYSTPEYVDLFRLFSDPKDERMLRLVLHRWGAKSTAEILDYVYFQTEPMEHGVRGERLDFSLIPEQEDMPYRRSSSGKTPEQIKELRRRFQEESAKRVIEHSSIRMTPPRYDDEFLEIMLKLENMD